MAAIINGAANSSESFMMTLPACYGSTAGGQPD
jgi:hypothetical protein